MPKVCWMYSVRGCTCRERFWPSTVSRKSNRMGKSRPKRACTRSPRSARGAKSTRSCAGTSMTVLPLWSSRLFSSSTPSKLQA